MMHIGRIRRFLNAVNIGSGLLILLLISGGCDYARMKDDEAVNLYQTTMPEMPRHTVPTTNGWNVPKAINPKELHNPLPYTEENVKRGKLSYEYYCIHCHGPEAQGDGTVGQSFAPLPTNLKTPYVQQQSDGELFHKISYGFRRHPPLAYTVRTEECWAVIDYIHSLAEPGK